MSQELIAAVAALGFPEVGRSSEGRAIVMGRFSGPPAPARRVVLVVAGVHGDEPSSVAAAIELAGWLGTTPPSPGVEVWVMPVLNPDGLAAGRKNSARDVDLNRNFPARNFQTAHQPGYFPGGAPASEPETRTLAAIVDEAGEALAGVVAVHAPFACVNYDGPAAAWAAAVAAASGWPVREDIGYPTPGSLGSWLGRDRSLPVLTVELPAGPYHPFGRKAQAALQTATHPERIR
jgi:protein MpaA